MSEILHRLALPAKSVWAPMKRQIRFATVGRRLTMADLTVLAPQNEPYRQDTPANHAMGQWFAEQVERLLRPDQAVHLRGLHYRLISSTAIMKLDGMPYSNTNDDWIWLSTKASKSARWLRYVPWERIVDERNEAPRIYDDGIAVACEPRKAQMHAGYDIEIPDLDELLPGISFGGGYKARQPFRIVLIGEKTSLSEVLDPIARLKAVELLLPTGDISDTMIYDMAHRAAADGRPLVVLYFSDFDPSSHHMPTCMSRKLMAFRDIAFPDLRVVGVYDVALRIDQVLEHELPEFFLKETETRAGVWRARWGREQTEIDALAALRPEVLRDITLAALRPFFDNTLADRQRDLNLAYQGTLYNWLQNYLDTSAFGDELTIKAYRQAVVDAAKQLDAAQRSAADTMLNAMDNTPDLPDEATGRAEPILSVDPPTLIYTSDDDWKTATLKLIERKRLIDAGGAQ